MDTTNYYLVYKSDCFSLILYIDIEYVSICDLLLFLFLYMMSYIDGLMKESDFNDVADMFFCLWICRFKVTLYRSMVIGN